MAYPVPLSHHAEHFGWRGNRGPNDSPVHEDDRVTYSVPSTERLLNAKHFSRLPPKSVARQEALWRDTLREGSVRALCQGREYNSSGLTCHLKEAVRARNSIEEPDGVGSPGRPFSKKKTRKDGAHSQDPARGKHRARKAAANAGLQGPGKRPQGIETRIPFRREP